MTPGLRRGLLLGARLAGPGRSGCGGRRSGELPPPGMSIRHAGTEAQAAAFALQAEAGLVPYLGRPGSVFRGVPDEPV